MQLVSAILKDPQAWHCRHDARRINSQLAQQSRDGVIRGASRGRVAEDVLTAGGNSYIIQWPDAS